MFVNKLETDQALDKIKKALFETVGPIADMVYEDCFEQWESGGTPDISRISSMIDHIEEEIDDQKLFAEFKGKISSLL
ncbi:MAG: hypothetical protein ABFS19_06865 [Thermodesulfobacteriota bacterium]